NQLLQGRFTVALSPEPERFPVQQGDVLAFTGQSGIGSPHLHFEILDADDRPTNPLLKRYDLVDTITPVIKSLAVIPLSATSRVDGDVQPLLLRPGAIRAGKFVIDQAVEVKGLIGFAVNVYDKMDGTWNGFGVYRLSLHINEQPVFTSQCDYFSYRQNRQANLDRDYRLMKRGRGLYNRLFRDTGNDLPFYGSDEPYYGVVAFAEEVETSIFTGLRRFFGLEEERPAGVIDLPAGEHSFVIKVEDFFGNTSSLKGSLMAVPGVSEKSHPGVALKSKGAMPLRPEIACDFYDDYVRVQIVSSLINGTKPALAAHYDNGSSEQLFVNTMGEGRYVAGLPLFDWRPGPVLLQVLQEGSDGKIKLLEQELHYTPIMANRTGTVVSENGLCKVQFGKRSLFKSIYVRMRPLSAESMTDAFMIGDAFEIQPIDVPLRRGVRVSMRINPAEAEHVALFRRNNKNGWEFAGDSLNAMEGWMSAVTGELGVFALIRDDAPPLISGLTPANGMRLKNRRPMIKAKLVDTLSDIGREEDWALFLDGAKMIAEYDPELHTLSYQSETPLSVGLHSVRIWVRDRCGNEAESRTAFYIQ
ncbi:hypothetical protein JXO59_06390, partial [candidate division KSB1 bacterium]|nr:hypothetical protein [candidate division KSB1 bacterium]